MNTVASTYLKAAFNVCVDEGCSSDALIKLVPGGQEALNDPLLRMPCEVLIDLFWEAERLLGVTGIGLKVGGTFRPSTFLDFGYGLMSCASLREAMIFNRNYQAVNQQLGQATLYVRGDLGVVEWETPYDAEYLRPATEAVFTGYVGIGKWITWTHGEELLGLSFRHSRPGHADIAEQILECPIKYNAPRDQLEFDAGIVDLQLPAHNPQLVQSLSHRLDAVMQSIERPNSTAQATYRLIERTLAEGVPSVGDIAAKLNMSERTLRRRLADDQQTFREILMKVRRDVCEIYMSEPDRSMSEIAQLLGYSEHSAFIRAFRGWFGVTPSKYSRSENR